MFLSLFLSLFISCLAFGDNFTPPDQKIVGAEKAISLGELGVISVSKPADTPMLAKVTYQWKLFDANQDSKSFMVDADGKMFFGTGLVKKKLLVVCSVTYQFEEYVAGPDGKPTNVLKQYVVKNVILTSPITIGDDTPGPGPNPVPPNPQVVLPDGKYKVSQKVYTLASKVPDNSRVSGAKILADSYDSIASAISAGTITTIQDILTKTTEKNTTSLAAGNVNKVEWTPFFSELQNIVFDLYQNETLKTKDDFAQCWKEISLAFKAVK